ncbi:MAG: hypothetical protein A4E60_01362 [Syntrophorhabdus sp. PtaB.Bin047]|jgi:hypothetical protein|nr:MAG: hypothetical protein A4E60_01362 [Syntrophorhabdus sp. PtaB.Bin047]
MKRCGVVLGIILVMTALVIGFGPAPAGAAGPLDACSLLTKADAEALLNQTSSSHKAGKVSAPAGNQCAYFFKKKGGTYSAKLKVSSSEEIKSEGIFKSARDVFDRQKKARMANADTAQKMRSVGGLGDEAFWNGYDLWVVKGGYLLTILVQDHLAGSFKSREAMDKARAEQDFNLSQRAASVILLKIK